MSLYSVQIWTPRGLVTELLHVSEVLLSTERGPLHVLQNHIHILVALSDGLAVFAGDQINLIYICDGLCKILDNKITIFCSKTIKSEELDQAYIVSQMEEIQHKLEDENIPLEEAEDLFKNLKKFQTQKKLFSKKSQLEDFIFYD